MKLIAPCTLLTLAVAATCLRAEDEGRWMVKARGTSSQVSNGSEGINALYITSNSFQVNNKASFELDLDFYLSKNLSLELGAGPAVSHTLQFNSVNLDTSLGTFKESTSFLTLRYHFLPDEMVDPYFGLGMNKTTFGSAQISYSGSALTLGSHDLGVAMQLGLDVKFASHWYANVDIKYFQSKTDLNTQGALLTTLSLNPMAYSVGIGYRF